MKKLLKILGWTAGSLAVLAILLVVGLRLFLPAEKLRDLAVARASAQLGREVTVQDVRVSLRGGLGIQLTDVAVGNPPGYPDGAVLTARSVDLKLRLGPLLSRQFHADRLVIDEPVLALIRRSEQDNNFTIAAVGETDASGNPADQGAGTAVVLERFQVNRGLVRFEDQEGGSTITCLGLDLDWNLTDARDGTSTLTGPATADSLLVAGDAPLSLAQLSMEQETRFVAGSDPLDLQGTLELTGGRLILPALDEPVTGLRGTADFDRTSVDVESLVAGLAGADLRFAGSISGLDRPGTAQIDGALETTADLAGVRDMLPEDHRGGLAGRAGGTLRLRGVITDPGGLIAGGKINVTDLSYRSRDIFEPLVDLDADLSFDSRDLIIESCSAEFSPSRFTVTGTVQGLVTTLAATMAGAETAADLPHLEFALQAPHFNVDHLFPSASPGTGNSKAGAGSPRALTEFPDFTGIGSVAIDRLIYSGVTFTEITGDVRIADRTVTVRDARGLTLAGQVAGQTAVDFRDMAVPVYSGAFAAHGLQADSLLTRFTPLAGHLFGSLDLTGVYEAAGRDPQVFRESLTLDGTGKLAEGHLQAGGTVRDGLQTLATATGRSFSDSESLRDLAYAVKVADQRVLLEKIRTELPGLGTLTLGGGYGFAGDLDFTGEILLTQENSAKLVGGSGGLAGAIGGLLGRGDEPVQRLPLPVRIGGTWDKPDVAVDFAGLTRAAGEDLADQLKGKLEGLIKR